MCFLDISPIIIRLLLSTVCWKKYSFSCTLLPWDMVWSLKSNMRDWNLCHRAVPSLCFSWTPAYSNILLQACRLSLRVCSSLSCGLCPQFFENLGKVRSFRVAWFCLFTAAIEMQEIEPQFSVELLSLNNYDHFHREWRTTIITRLAARLLRGASSAAFYAFLFLLLSLLNSGIPSIIV